MTIFAIPSGAASNLVRPAKLKPKDLSDKQLAALCRASPSNRYAIMCVRRAKRDEERNRAEMWPAIQRQEASNANS